MDMEVLGAIMVQHKHRDQRTHFLSLFHKRWWLNCLSVYPAPPRTTTPPLVPWAECWIRPFSLSSNVDPLTPVGLVNFSTCSAGDLWFHLGWYITYHSNLYIWCQCLQQKDTDVMVGSQGYFQWLPRFREPLVSLQSKQLCSLLPMCGLMHQ